MVTYIRDIFALVCSDWHLGGRWMTDPKTALKVLKRYPFKNLIFIGDLFDSIYHLTDGEREVIEYLRKLDVEKIYFKGNHDTDEHIRYIKQLGFEIVPEHEYRVNEWCGKKFLIIHGHQVDKLIMGFPRLNRRVNRIINWLKIWSIGESNNTISRDMRKMVFDWIVKIDRDTGEATNQTEILKRFALKLGKEFEVDCVITAHSHRPVHDTDGDIEYVNTGTINSKPYQQNSIVTIGPDGTVTLHLLEKELFE